MKRIAKCKLFVSGTLSALSALSISPAVAQIIPDDTLGAESSVVRSDFDVNGLPSDYIEGGALWGELLFHSFLDFNIAEGRGAYFANPAAVNTIFSRVTGVNASEIFGTLGVLGDADLVFLNPNGILFGPNAQLDLRGSFTGSTASGVELPNGEIFGTLTQNVLSLLTLNVDAPIGLIFEGSNTQAITNEGILAAPEDLTLAASTLDLQGQLYAGQDLTLQAQDTVQIRDSESSPFIAASGGGLLVQGDQTVDIFALNHPDSGLFSGSNMTLRSDNPVNGDAHYWSGGSFRIENLDGTTGDLLSPVDPIIRAFGDVTIGAYQGSSLHILAGGAVDIGTAFITRPDTGAVGVDFLRETIELSDGTMIEINGGAQPTLDVRAGVSPEAIGMIPFDNPSGMNPATDFFFDEQIQFADPVLGDVPTSADITVGDVVIDAANGLVLLTNQYEPNPALEGSVFVTGEGAFGLGIDARGLEFFGGQGGAVYLDARNDLAVVNSFIATSGSGIVGDIVINAGSTIRFEQQERITGAASNVETGEDGVGGDIRIRAANVAVINGAQLQANTRGSGNAGNVVITAEDSVRFDSSAVFSRVGASAKGTGGNVEITTTTLDVLNGAQLLAVTEGEGNAGDVMITADDRVRFDNGAAFSRVGASGNGTGGNVEITTATLDVLNGAQLVTATDGQGDVGNVMISASDSVRFDGGDAFSRVNSEAMGRGGNVIIAAAALDVLNGAQLIADTRGQGDAGNVVITAGDRVRFEGTSSNGQFFSGAFSLVEFDGTGGGGNVEITATTLDVLNGAQLQAVTRGQGDAGNVVINANDNVRFGSASLALGVVDLGGRGTGGNVEINATTLEVLNGSQLSTATLGEGDAGNVVITVRDLVRFEGAIANGRFPSAAFSRVEPSGRGTGGNVIINTTFLEVINGAELSASTLGDGGGGNVVITVSDRARFDDSNTYSRIESSGRGTGGNVEINATTLEVLNGSQLSTTTFGQGDAGNVVITAGDLVQFDDSAALSRVEFDATGAAGNIVVTANTLELINGAQLLANTRSTGDAGTVEIAVRERVAFQGVDLAGRPSGIFTSSATLATGQGNDIRIAAPLLILQDGAVLIASTANAQPGGDILLMLGRLDVLGGGQIVTSSLDSGTAGTIVIDVAERIYISGRDSTFANRVTQIPELNLFFDSQSRLSVQSTGTGAAGNIIIGAAGTTPSILLDDGGQIIAESAAVDGGNISLNLTGPLLLRNGSLISATAGTSEAGGNGGNISIDSGSVFAVPQENSDILANAFEGNGGQVEINADGIFGIAFRDQQTPFSDVTANSQLGNPGIVTINTLEVDPNQGLATLPEEPRAIEIADSCQQNPSQDSVALFNLGQGGTPPNPDSMHSANADLVGWVSLDLAELPLSSQNTNNSAASPSATVSESATFTAAPHTLTFLPNHASRQLRVTCHAN